MISSRGPHGLQCLTFGLGALALLAGCGDRTDKAPTAAPGSPAASSTPAATAPVLQIRSETRTFRDWQASCGNDGNCWAFGFAPDFGAGWIRIALAPGPDAQPQISFGFWPVSVGPPARQLSLDVDGRVFPASMSPDGTKEAPIGVIAGGDARALIDALAQGKSLTLRGGANQAVSLNGAAASLLWIDDKQGRLDTSTALIRRGAKPSSTVPTAPPLPTVTLSSAVSQAGFGDTGQTVPDALLNRSDVANCMKESVTPDVTDTVASARLDANTELWAIPCGAGAYNITQAWFLTGPGGRDARPVALVGTGGPGADPTTPDNTTINGAYDPKTRLLTAFPKGRGLGDCGTLQTWGWTGRQFVLTKEQTMGECAGVDLDYWPTTWRARTN